MRIPLSELLRPKSIDDVFGQEHLFSKDKLLYKIIKNKDIPNLIFYGPSGSGKTTVAKIIASETDKTFFALNGTNASLSDVKDIASQIGTMTAPNGILLYLDEIQYFNKKQQQALLEYIEKGEITLIASTTENPAFYIYSALLSRSNVFEFKALKTEDILKALKRAVEKISSNYEIEVEDGAIEILATSASGDVRKALNFLELFVLASDKKIEITKEKSIEAVSGSGKYYDKQGDYHYDLLSAYQKSMRGSDIDASLYYLAKLLDAGDLISAVRRLLVCANEDVGLAYPQIISIVKSACDTAMQLGLPEARIPLANAVILVASSPKSNSAYNAINMAMDDVRSGKGLSIPRNLQNKHYDGKDAKKKGQFYLYPHDFKNHWVDQNYLPEDLQGVSYFIPGENKFENNIKKYWNEIKKDKNIR
ncbi:MAG: replication-associated recombination protein A [Clostridia bacterium]|nr:replication-associated recombination protein A [Clostridia bacterium]